MCLSIYNYCYDLFFSTKINHNFLNWILPHQILNRIKLAYMAEFKEFLLFRFDLIRDHWDVKLNSRLHNFWTLHFPPNLRWFRIYIRDHWDEKLNSRLKKNLTFIFHQNLPRFLPSITREILTRLKKISSCQK